MAWPKIKNIIILILLGTNLGLLFFSMGRAARNYQLQEKARTNAIAFLQEHGITLDEEMVPKSMTLMPQLVSRDIEQERELAAVLLGENVSVQARGAEVYRYFNETGSVQFHSNGEFFAQFFTGAIPVGAQDPADHAREMLERMNIQGQLFSTLSNEEKGSETFTFQESWEGVPLLNCQTSLEYQEGCLVSITSGRRPVGRMEEDTASSPITVPTALMKFYTGLNTLGDVCSQIKDITQAYTIGSAISDPVPMTPVWCINTDTGSYQLDLLTGTLSRTLGQSIQNVLAADLGG